MVRMRRVELSVKRNYNIHPAIYCVGVVLYTGKKGENIVFFFKRPKNIDRNFGKSLYNALESISRLMSDNMMKKSHQTVWSVKREFLVFFFLIKITL